MSGTSGLRSRIHSHFMRRWRDHLRKQFGVIRSVADSAVLFYIGIPALLVILRSSYGLWREELPDWLLQLPYAVIPILLYVIIYIGGGLLTYQEAADVLFLRQSREWSKGIIFRGILASMAAQALLLGLAVVFLMPVLVRVYALNEIEILLLYLTAVAVKAASMLVGNLVGIVTVGWRRALLELVAAIVLGAVFIAGVLLPKENWPASIILVIAIWAMAAWLIRKRMRTEGKFDAEIRMEEYEKTRLTGMVLSGAVSNPRKSRARPWLFRRSNPVLKSGLPEDRVAAATMKSFFRGSELVLYAQFTGLGIVAVTVPPFPVNIVVFILLISLLYYWMNGYRKLFMEKDLLVLLPVEPELKLRSAVPSNRLLLLPGVVIISGGLGISLLDRIWGIALAVPAAAFMIAIPWIWKIKQRLKRE